jgi:aminobenzoyl-glutamate utilization protein B
MTIWNKTFAKAKRAKMAGMVALLPLALASNAAQAAAPAALKTEVAADVDAQTKNLQVMIDTVFSFAEPGFQEVRTSAYLADILEKNGFKVTRGVAGIPTAFTATWGEGGPLIALGSDIDGLLGVSQTPVHPPSSLWCPARQAMAKGIIRACR